jgi:hypothetical protein
MKYEKGVNKLIGYRSCSACHDNCTLRRSKSGRIYLANLADARAHHCPAKKKPPNEVSTSDPKKGNDPRTAANT